MPQTATSTLLVVINDKHVCVKAVTTPVTPETNATLIFRQHVSNLIIILFQHDIHMPHRRTKNLTNCGISVIY